MVLSTQEGGPSRLPQPGQTLGHYSIRGLLGQGGMGAVFDAEDLETGRRVALKVLSEKLDSPAARERFFREGRLAASINHPNSVYVFGTEEIGGTPVIAMELVTGGTLQERVRGQGPLPVSEAVDCTLQIVAGLEAAHLIGILHRDIKPSNCFRSADGTIKIGDFGLSISTAIRTEPALTVTGAFMGTPAFCSPEQLRGDELNVRSDMYALGATLFYLLTGHTPFEGKNVVQLLATVLEQRAPSPRRFRAEVPPGLANVVLRCLEKQPGDRFSNYQELLQVLAPYGSAAPTPATLGLRFLAGVVDTLMLSLVSLASCWLIFGSPVAILNLAVEGSPKWWGWTVTWLAVATLYYAVFEGLWGAALGKALFGLRVVRLNKSAPGISRALLRALVCVVVPGAPCWLVLGANPRAYAAASAVLQNLLGFSAYFILISMFCTARRRNGFAAVQDFLTQTRVISRAGFQFRPIAFLDEAPPADVVATPALGPYHVLETLEKTETTSWLLGYDLRLLRKVWIRTLPSGIAPVSTSLRNLGRVGRLRWLAGRRSPEENWDAFEALTGSALLRLVQTRQPWERVRFWLLDLAKEISAAASDGTLPALRLDRVWITGDGRAKLLDFSAPGLSSASVLQPSPGDLAWNQFLDTVASAALEGQSKGGTRTAGEARVPLPLQVRAFLKSLCSKAEPQSVIEKLGELVQRAATITRLRRAAVAAGCAAVPVMACLIGVFGTSMLQYWNRTNPGLIELNNVLEQRSITLRYWANKSGSPTERQFAIYIASHYRSVVTNGDIWTNFFGLTLIKGEARRFAERSISEHPAPTPAEVADADAALKPIQSKSVDYDLTRPPWRISVVLALSLIVYVCLPALLAALVFRGGLVLLIARVTFVRSDGRLASRLRVFWRALVAWSPLLLGLLLFGLLHSALGRLGASIAGWLVVCSLAAISVMLPERGLPERLSGTWPVPR